MPTQIAHPDVPGSIIRFTGQKIPRILPAAADTVMIPIVHDWGPLGSDPGGSSGLQGGAQECLSFDEFTSIYGDSDTPGRTAVAGAFAGQNLAGAVGAGGVIVYRMASSAVAAATIIIQTFGGSPVNALTLTAKYKGTRGNSLTYTVDADPSNVLRDRLRIFYLGVVQETYLYLQTDVINLTAAINNRSKLVTAVNNEVTPARLKQGSAALATGNDGLTLTPTDHGNALNALALAPASLLAAYDVTDSPTLAVYLSFVQAQLASSRPVRWVSGGAAGETIDTALARALTLEDPHAITFGVGTWHDDLLNKDLSTSQLAPRIAGILASRGEVGSITFAKIGGLHVVGATAPTSDGITAAVNGGVVVLMPTGAADADVRIAKGVTTWTQDLPTQPLGTFGDARLVGVMDNYVRNMKQWGDDTVVGDLPVNDDTRRLVYGEATRLIKDLLRRGLILPGDGAQIPTPFVQVQNTDADPVYNDTIPYTFGWQFARTANAILGQGTVL